MSHLRVRSDSFCLSKSSDVAKAGDCHFWKTSFLFGALCTLSGISSVEFPPESKLVLTFPMLTVTLSGTTLASLCCLRLSYDARFLLFLRFGLLILFLTLCLRYGDATFESQSETRISSRRISSWSGLNLSIVLLPLRSEWMSELWVLFLEGFFRTGSSIVSVSALFLMMRDLSLMMSIDSSRGLKASLLIFWTTGNKDVLLSATFDYYLVSADGSLDISEIC